MSDVLLEHNPPLTRITLNRPVQRNPLSLSLMEELTGILNSLPTDTEVVILGANGPVFSAGHDLTEMVDRPPSFYQQLFDTCTVLMETIHRLPQPVIAAVQGTATAGGCQLVASCDLVVAADTATFATPGVKIGLFCSTPMVPISRAVGRKRALQMLLTGDPIDAQTACEWGLVNQVVPAMELAEATTKLARQICRFSSQIVGIGKEAFYSQMELDEHRAYDLTKAVMSANASLPDAQEGIGAFLEKRTPVWSTTVDRP